MGWMLSSKTPSLGDRQGIARGQRPQHSRESRFASAVLRVDEGEPREGDVRRTAYGIELANVPEELEAVDHAPALSQTRSPSFIRSSPEMSLGSRLSRRAVAI